MPMPNTKALGEHYAKNGHPAWVLASHLPKAHGVPMSEMGTVWTDEWDDEGETWGVANNGTGADRLWYGPVYTLQNDQTVAIEHPAGSHVVAIDGQALLVARPDGPELFCDSDATQIWEEAAIRSLWQRIAEVGEPLGDVEEWLQERDA